jgi:hypothetical protein
MENIYKELKDYIVYPYMVEMYDERIQIKIHPDDNGKNCSAITKKLINKLSQFGEFDFVAFQNNIWTIEFVAN